MGQILEFVVKDKLGQVWRYVRPNGKCPAREFLEDLEERFQKRFRDSFGAVAMMGSDYSNQDRFKSLHDDGKPLWEFKEKHYRLYCHRIQTGKTIYVILFNGWKKNNQGKRTPEEKAQIQKAQTLLTEYRQATEEKRK
jgi:hypothetical protein